MNQFSALSHFLPRQLLTITRESILSCPALSTIFPGRLARRFRERARIPLNNNDQPAQACTAIQLCTWAVRVGIMAKREVAESLGDGGLRGA